LDAVGDDQMGVQQRVTLPRGPVVEADRQQPLAGHVLDTAMAAAGPQVSVQVADRLGQPSVMGGQHGSSDGRVAEAVEDRDALGGAQDHVEGGHGVAAVGTAEEFTGRGVAAFEHGLEPDSLAISATTLPLPPAFVGASNAPLVHCSRRSPDHPRQRRL
jgi:5-hydroxyisourate hydrolase-like protein (transthyretin family)